MTTFAVSTKYGDAPDIDSKGVLLSSETDHTSGCPVLTVAL